MIYFIGPATRKNWRIVSPGSSLATLMSIAASYGFSIYVGNLAKYSMIYGSIGAILILLLWLHINSLVLLIGFELNNSIYYKKNFKQLMQQEKASPTVE